MVRGAAAETAREAMRARLVDAAAHVVVERGVRATTTRAVAEAAGVAEGSIYNHFGSKQDLIAAALVKDLPDLGGELTEAATGTDAVQALHRLGRTALTFYEHLLPVMAEVAADPELARRVQEALARLHRGPLRFHAEVARLLAAAEHAGQVRLSGPAPIVAALLLGACREWAAVRRFGLPEAWPQRPDDFVAAAVATLVEVPAS